MTNSLMTATFQDIQLELIRRRKFNQFDGPAVFESLLKHHQLWLSAFMTMPQMIVNSEKMPFLCLQPLYSMLENHWAADTLFVLCDTQGQAEQLREIAQQESWQFDADDILIGDLLGSAIGISPIDKAAVLRLWWD